MKMNRIARNRIARSLAALALAAMIVPAVHADDKDKKVVKRIVVKDGQVWTSENDEPLKLGPGTMVKRGWLGVNLVEITPELREHYRTSKDAGVLVSRVEGESPAAKSGIRTGDVITAIDGVKVDSPGDIAREIREKKSGDSVRLEYTRDGVKGVAVASVVERERPQIELREFNMSIPEIGFRLPEHFDSPEFKARLERLGDCGKMQGRIQELEQRLKDLEKKLNR
jgi:membrane-associated protease RseP (regulator of RpoE activity)